MNMHKTIMEMFETRDKWTPLPFGVRRNRNYLGKLFYENGLNRGAEIGVRNGDFSKILCEANPNIELWCVDPWVRYGAYKQESQDQRYENTCKKLAPYNVTILRMKSMEAIHEFRKKPLDFVYIDGDHRFDHCMQDLIEWSRRVRKGGIVAVHDYGNLAGDVGDSS